MLKLCSLTFKNYTPNPRTDFLSKKVFEFTLTISPTNFTNNSFYYLSHNSDDVTSENLV